MTVQVQELETQLKELTRRCVGYESLLRTAQEKIQLLQGASAIPPDALQQLEQWLVNLEVVVAGNRTKDNDGGESTLNKMTEQKGGSLCQNDVLSPRSANALRKTIEQLQSELERCLIDLQTDEELFTEKANELSALQGSYDHLLEEKDRMESLWTAAKEMESKLQQMVSELMDTVSVLKVDLADKEATILQLKAQSSTERPQFSVGASMVHHPGDGGYAQEGISSHTSLTYSDVTDRCADDKGRLEARHEKREMYEYVSEDDSLVEEGERDGEEESGVSIFSDFLENCTVLRGKVETCQPEVIFFNVHGIMHTVFVFYFMHPHSTLQRKPCLFLCTL